MGLKTTIKNLLQALYRLLTGVLIIVAVLLIITVGINVGIQLSLSISTLILCTIVAIGIVIYVLKNRKRVNNDSDSSFVFSREIIKIGVFFYVFFSIVSHIYRFDSKNNNSIPLDESVKLHVDSSDVNIKKYYLSQQSWTDFNRNNHSLPFKVNYDDVINSKKNRNSLKTRHRYNWGKLYKSLSDNDKPLVEALAQTFYKYQQDKNMDRREFAELMISAIQDIPYTLILDDSCDNASIKPCYGNITLGLFAPAEFVSNLRGDCDTRTVLLFTLLSRFNYDIAILNSSAYRHSVLGINIPATGKFKTFRFKKYYFVETTARGCPIGYLSKEFSDVNKWDFTLIHNIKI